MSYPTLPLGAMDAAGAFEIGGGDFSFGQDYNEALIKSLFKVPTPTLSNALDLLEEYLLKLPLEALEGFKELIPDVLEDDFANVTSAVTKIMATLAEGPLFFKSADWQSFLDNFGGAVEDVVQKFEDVYDSVIQAIKDMLTGIVDSTPTDLDNWLLGLLTGESDLDAAKLVNIEDIPAIAKEKIDGLTDALEDAVSDAQKAVRDALTGIVDSTPTDLDDWLLDLLTGSSSLDAAKLTNISGIPSIPKTKVTDLVSDLGGIIDNVVTGLGNLTGTGFTVPNMLSVLQDVQATQAQLSAGLAALQADAKGQVSSGLAANVNIANYAAGAVPGIFTLTTNTGSGNAVVAGGALDFSGTVVGSEFYQLATDLLTDYFEVSMVMPRRPGGNWLTGGGSNYTYLTGRGNSAGTRRCQARIGYDTLRAGTLVDGTTTWFGSDVSFKTPAGAYVTFRGGTSGGVRIFQILVNNEVKLTVTDTGAVSYVGAAYRRVGWGLAADATYLPGSISILTYNDNVPSPTDGTVCEVYRAATGNTNVSTSTAEQAIQGNIFDTVNVQSPDIAWAASTSTFTVSKAGNYILQFRFDSSSSFGSQTCRMLAYVNGTLAKRGPDTQLSLGSSVDGYGHTFFLRLAANDTVRPGVWFGSTSPVTCYGDATGTLTYMSLTRVPS